MTKQPGNATVNVFQQISEICREFGKHLSKGKAPRIEKLLSQVSEEGREHLFANLLATEINYRRSEGESPTSDEYLGRFPQFKKQVRRAFFEPTMASVDAGASSDGEAQTKSLGGSDRTPEAPTQTFELANAKRLGEYELIREVGRGGMGVVYEARHEQTNNRVALKTLPTGGDGQQVNAEKLHRFRKEFRRLSEINHRNLVGMQNLEFDGDHWFFTMDLVDGVDFLSYVRPHNHLDEERLRAMPETVSHGGYRTASTRDHSPRSQTK